MDKKAAFEMVGALGVIASLVFVGVQVRQSAEETRAATVLQLKVGWVQVNLAQVENPESIRALGRVLEVGYTNVDADSRILVDALYRTIAHNWSNAYFQYRIGTLDDEQWRGLTRDMEHESRRQFIWDFWDVWGYVYDDAFQAYMDSLRSENAPTSPKTPESSEQTDPGG